MKNISVIFLSLFALTFGLCGNAVAAPVVTSITANQTDAAASSATTKQILSTEDYVEIGYTCLTGSKDECIDTAGSTILVAAAVDAAVPVAVSIASSAGVTASTGTTISALSGAAATSATLASFGSTIISATGGILAGVAAPAVIGGAVITGAGMAVGGLVGWLIYD